MIEPGVYEITFDPHAVRAVLWCLAALAVLGLAETIGVYRKGRRR